MAAGSPSPASAVSSRTIVWAAATRIGHTGFASNAASSSAVMPDDLGHERAQQPGPIAGRLEGSQSLDEPGRSNDMPSAAGALS